MMESSLENAFDRAAEQIFVEIPAKLRRVHDGELVFIDPHADTTRGPPYVFGKSIGEILMRANECFGPETSGELMSLATDDGSVPDDDLLGMRGLY